MSDSIAGKTATVHYTGRLTDGTVFDSSEGREPLSFEMGASQVIPGFESAVQSLDPGSKTTITIPAVEAYGDVREDLLWELEKSKLPPEIEPAVGMQLESVQPDGTRIQFIISSVSEGAVMLDANHPLAGQDLIFDIELVNIQ